jgi:hypothetical protein
LHEISLNDRSKIQAIIVITILAILETFFGLIYALFYPENFHDELTLHGIISTFSIFERIFRDLYVFLYPVELYIETNISLLISNFLMFYIYAILFTYILTIFINKLGGELMPISCLRIIGLSFLFEIILVMLIEPIRLLTIGTQIPWDILIFIPLILQFVVISLGIKSISELSLWKVGISIIIAFFTSIVLAFIIAGIIIKGIINDLLDYKPGLLVIIF